jgi:ubiquinone/menaquinone biosynthesis C-methylase UbiE
VPANRGDKRLPLGAGGSSFELIDGAALFGELRLKKGSVFLDIACGRGAYTLAAACHVGPAGVLYAVDLWSEGIARLKAEAAARGIANLKASIADAGERLPIGGREVDVALMATVLHDLVEDGKADGALRETARVLKPGGRFAVVEFKKIDGPPGPPREVRLDAKEVESLASRFGFAKRTGLDLSPYHYLLIFGLHRHRLFDE